MDFLEKNQAVFIINTVDVFVPQKHRLQLLAKPLLTVLTAIVPTQLQLVFPILSKSCMYLQWIQ